MIQIKQRRRLAISLPVGDLAVTVRPLTGAEHIEFDALASTNLFLRLSLAVSGGADHDETLAALREQAGDSPDAFVERMKTARVEAFASALEFAAAIVTDWHDVTDDEGNPVPLPADYAARRDLFAGDPLGEPFVLRVMFAAVLRARGDAGNGRRGSPSTTAASRTPVSSAGHGETESAAPGGA